MKTDIDFHEKGKNFHVILKSIGDNYTALIYEKSKKSDLVTPISVYWLKTKSEKNAIERVRKTFIKSNGKKGLFDLYGKKRVRV
jgi:hypothetical protein